MDRFRVLCTFFTVIVIACHGGISGLDRSLMLGVRIPVTTALSR